MGMRGPSTNVRARHLQLINSVVKTRQSDLMTGCLHSREQPCTWNDWSEGDLLLQLAGHLHGRALQEWDLIPEDIKSTFRTAVDALRDRLDPGGWMLAVQDFRHAAQKSEESVADFIRCLERCFRVAYGRDNLGKEAQEAFFMDSSKKASGWN